jgi:starch synthase
MSKTFKIACLASEVAPYSKTGGLADVVKALAKELANQGHHVIIITPFYGFIKKQNLPLEVDKRSFTVQLGYKKLNWGFRKLDFSKNLKIYFISNYDFFGRYSRIYGSLADNLRFMFFNLASLQLLEIIKFEPDIIHCHDWQTGLVPNFLKVDQQSYNSLKETAVLYTIHNLAFQFGGNWPYLAEKHKDEGNNYPSDSLKKIPYINFMKRGIIHADVINTVSERYAKEILTSEFGLGLEKILYKRRKYLFGIINGIDYTVYNPSFDENIYVKYDWNSLRRKSKNKLALQKEVGLEQKADMPLIGVVNRLTEQKGFNLIMETFPVLMKLNMQIVVVGSGLGHYVNFFNKMAKKYPKGVGFYSPFTEKMAARVYAGSDIFLMPSHFEPCGVSQLISLRYGSIPIVHETGGLSETITNFNPKTRKGNGFVFSSYTREDFLIAIARALENYKYPQVWEYLTWQAMRQSYSWELPAKKYLRLYQLAIKRVKK